MFQHWQIKERLCQDNFSQKRQIEIHEHYLGLSKELQNKWISHLVDTVTPAQLRRKTLGRKGKKSHPNFSFRKGRTWKSLSLPKNISRYSWSNRRRVIQTILSKTSTSRMVNISDKRGKHTPAIQKKEEIYQLVIEYTQKLCPCISHYRRAHAPNRLYISP